MKKTKIDYQKNKKGKKYEEINKCIDEINKILTKYEYEVDISEWLVFTNKKGSFSFSTNEKGLLIVE